MARARSRQELEFELALTGVLEDVYDLRVRSPRDPLNRRRNGYTTLEFSYRYAERDPGAVEVQVTAREWPELAFAMKADFDSPESTFESAERCEDLALVLRARLEDVEAAEGAGPSRRWDD